MWWIKQMQGHHWMRGCQYVIECGAFVAAAPFFAQKKKLHLFVHYGLLVQRRMNILERRDQPLCGKTYHTTFSFPTASRFPKVTLAYSADAGCSLLFSAKYNCLFAFPNPTPPRRLLPIPL